MRLNSVAISKFSNLENKKNTKPNHKSAIFQYCNTRNTKMQLKLNTDLYNYISKLIRNKMHNLPAKRKKHKNK